jgi:hypothetical protein
VDKELQSTETRTTCYFFFKDDNEDQMTATKALSALLHQLFSKKCVLLRHALKIFKENGKLLTESFFLLWNILEAASADRKAKEIICILDALDECRKPDQILLLRELCSFYRKLRCSKKSMTLKFLVTSRPYQCIEGEFNKLIRDIPTIRLAGEEETVQITQEINLVIDAEIDKIQREMQLDQDTIFWLREEFARVEHRTYCG